MQAPQPSEDEKAQFRADYPCVLRNAPRFGAVSQFTKSPDKFTMIRPEVEVHNLEDASLLWAMEMRAC